MTILLLLLSIVLSTGRNLFSKNLPKAQFGTKKFFRQQSLLLFFGTLAVLAIGNVSITLPSPITLMYSLIFALFLICAQWFFTVALAAGNVALCSTVYAMGFIIPTLSGVLFWSEPFSVINILGVLCAVAAIFCSGYSPDKEKSCDKGYFLPLVLAMLASGGLGLMQKVQQKSNYADEKASFLFIAFLLAALISLLASFAAKKNEDERTSSSSKKVLLITAGAGATFGSYNLLNTTLAGIFPSAVFFPVFNISVIILTMLCGTVILKERLCKKDILVLALGGTSILLLSVF